MLANHPFSEIMDADELRELSRSVQCGVNAPWPFVVEWGEPIRIWTKPRPCERCPGCNRQWRDLGI